MAFETFLTIDKQKPRKGRRITIVVSLAVHVALLAAGVAASYASVEELSPKNPIVTIHFPPPPPPPAALRGSDRPKTRKPRPERVQPRLTALVAPKDTPKVEEEKDDDGPGTDPHGAKDGVRDGIGAGDGNGETQTHFLPPNVARGQLAIDPQADEHRAKLPAWVHHAGMSVFAFLRVCVDRDGNVVDVKVLKGVDAAVDASFTSAVRTWRYTPFRVDGRPVPFCTNVRYEVRTTN